MKIWVSETLTSINGFSKLYQFEVEASKQISALKIDVSNKILIDSSNFDFYRNDFLLDNNKSIESFQISENYILQICLLDKCSLNSVNVQENYLNINIKQFLRNEINGVKIEKFHVKSNCSIKSFYYQLKCEGKIHNLKSLFHLNRLLENDKTFQESEIEDYDEIKLVDNVVLVNYENCLYDTKALKKLNLESEELSDNLLQLSQVWNTDSNFISVIYDGKIVKDIPNGIYLSFICDGDDIGDSIIVYIEESFSEIGKITKHAILLNKNDSVNLIKKHIIDYLQINRCEFEIRLNDVIPYSNDTLLDYQIINGLTLTILFKINVTRLSSNDSYIFWMFPSDSIGKLKQFISTDLTIDVNYINLFFLGKLIPDEETLSENGILANSVILMSEEILSVYYVTLVNYKQCYLPENSEIDIDRIWEINFESNDVNENRHKLSLAINKNDNLINIFHEEKIIKVIPNGKYLYFIHDGNYCANSIIVYVKESLSTSGELKTLPILINKTDVVSSVIEKIKKIVNSEEELKIRFGENVLENDKMLPYFDIKNGSELILLIGIFFKSLEGQTKTLFISLCDTVKYLKGLISKLKQIKAEDINLSFRGNQLEDNKLCSEYKIDSGTTLMMIATIKGGVMVKFCNLIF